MQLVKKLNIHKGARTSIQATKNFDLKYLT